MRVRMWRPSKITETWTWRSGGTTNSRVLSFICLIRSITVTEPRRSLIITRHLWVTAPPPGGPIISVVRRSWTRKHLAAGVDYVDGSVPCQRHVYDQLITVFPQQWSTPWNVPECRGQFYTFNENWRYWFVVVWSNRSLPLLLCETPTNDLKTYFPADSFSLGLFVCSVPHRTNIY